MGEPILIVDDNPANLALLAYVLRNSGHAVTTARDAEEALAVLDTARPRLLMLDLQLPGMGGLELARRLRTDRRILDLIIIAVTAHAMRGDRELALAAGCDDFITKPIDTRTLPHVVADHLAGGRKT